MKYYDAAAVAKALPYDQLIEGLRTAFIEGCNVPLRALHHMAIPDGTDAVLVMMPAWQSGKTLAIKLATLFPDNANKNLPTIYATIMVFDGDTGKPVAVVDGTEVTRRRTAAASALASTYLSRDDASHLLMVGTGAQAPHNILAHAAVRPINKITIWGRTPKKVKALADSLQIDKTDIEVNTVTNLGNAAGEADIISCATSSPEPLIKGSWLKPGVHLDLVGAFTPSTRECDSDAVAGAKVYVDTRDGAMSEAGDILIPITEGVISEDDVLGDLFDLTRDMITGRQSADEITLFKSVGTGLEDLAGAKMVVNTD